MTDLPHIAITPGVCGGEPCIGGTRITARQAAHLWYDCTEWDLDEILRQYPVLTREGIIVACWWRAYYDERGRDSVRWRSWAKWRLANQNGLEDGDYDNVPLPPRKGEH